MNYDQTMPVLDRFSMLLVNNNRSKCYLQNFIQAGYRPEIVFILDAQNVILPEHTENDALDQSEADQTFVQTCKECSISFNEKEHILATAKKNGIRAEQLRTLDVNDPSVIDAISKTKSAYVIYSGPGGTILRNDLLNTGKKFLHAHPGWLPDYQGSTTIYYALLSGEPIGCSVLTFETEIDQGPIFYRHRFELNSTYDLDRVFDPAIRTRTLLDFFKTNWRKNPERLSQTEKQESETFYIIHPLLKHLAILSMKGASKQ